MSAHLFLFFIPFSIPFLIFIPLVILFLFLFLLVNRRFPPKVTSESIVLSNTSMLTPYMTILSNNIKADVTRRMLHQTVLQFLNEVVLLTAHLLLLSIITNYYIL